MKSIIVIITAVLAVFSSAYAAPQISEKTLHIKLDMSTSNPLIESEAYAKQAASFVKAEILELEPGATVKVSMFGSLTIENHVMSYEAQITRRNPAEAIGSTVEQLIASIPQSGFEPQGQTNILFQLEFMPVNCEAGDEIIVITDGIEASPDGGDPNALLERGEGLPTPKTTYLEGCEVIFFGVGLNDQGSWPRETVHNLVDAWRSYFKSSGADFRPIVLVH